MHLNRITNRTGVKIGSKLIITFIILYSKCSKGNYICKHTHDCENARKHIFIPLQMDQGHVCAHTHACLNSLDIATLDLQL